MDVWDGDGGGCTVVFVQIVLCRGTGEEDWIGLDARQRAMLSVLARYF